MYIINSSMGYCKPFLVDPEDMDPTMKTALLSLSLDGSSVEDVHMFWPLSCHHESM